MTWAEFYGLASRVGRALVGRGLAVGDLDNAGRLDVVVNNLDGSPELLHNQLGEVGHWLMLALVGKGHNSGAIGASVRVKAGPIEQTSFVRSRSSYISQEDKRLHFGLGPAQQADLTDRPLSATNCWIS